MRRDHVLFVALHPTIPLESSDDKADRRQPFPIATEQTNVNGFRLGKAIQRGPAVSRLSRRVSQAFSLPPLTVESALGYNHAAWRGRIEAECGGLLIRLRVVRLHAKNRVFRVTAGQGE